MNLIFGVIIDTFGDLRSEKQEKDYTLKNTCFICGLDRSKFDNNTVSFDEHTKLEHNLWHYLYFLILIKVKDKTEFTGPESFVFSCIQVLARTIIILLIFGLKYDSCKVTDLRQIAKLIKFFAALAFFY